MAVNSQHISRIEDGTGVYRNIWFGPGRMASTSSSIVSVTDTIQKLCPALNLAIVTENKTKRSYGVNPNHVFQVENSASVRNILFGGAFTNNLHTSVISVKETLA